MCTAVRFTDDQNQMYFGRNLDWECGYGERIVITPRGYVHHSEFVGDVATKYAIIGMGITASKNPAAPTSGHNSENRTSGHNPNSHNPDNQAPKIPLYFDCANEAGLAIAGLNFPGYARYESRPVGNKGNIAAYEFPLWVTQNFATVDEVADVLKNIAIIDQPVTPELPSSLLHWIIGDARRSIVVEYTERGMQIFENHVDVLANQPGFAWHQENLRNYMNLHPKEPKEVHWGKQKLTAFGSGSLMRGIPGDYYSPSRFVRVAYLNTHYPVQSGESANVSRLFHTLTGVAMIDGAAAMGTGHFEKTIFTGGYSTATQTYYYNTYEDPALRHASLQDHDLTASAVIEIPDDQTQR